MSLKSQIESLLFISNFPLTYKRLAELTGEKIQNVQKAIEALISEYQERKNSGVILVQMGQKIQMATNPKNASVVRKFVKDETTGELTRASLETLTIIAYRGPVTRTEIEHIRGVNCAIILRNLLMRGLIEKREDKKKMESVYTISFDFMRYLGIQKPSDLPDYERLNNAEKLRHLLEEKIEME